ILLDVCKHEFAHRSVDVEDGDALQLKRLRAKLHKDSGKFVDTFLRIGKDYAVTLKERLLVGSPLNLREISFQIPFAKEKEERNPLITPLLDLRLLHLLFLWKIEENRLAVGDKE